MTVGVIGVGMIGQDHIRRLTHVLSGAQVVAVTDVDPARAQQIADGLPGCAVHATGQELIKDETVDAVMVTSWGPTHEEYVLASIEAGKPVFCEKPLATTQEACRRIVDAEVASVRVDEPPDVTDVGLNVAVTPDGRPLAESATDCADPDVVAVLTVVVAELPAATEPEVGEAAMEKSFAGGVVVLGT